MGGLVGGLYSTGKSSAELHDIIKKQNWPLLLGGATPYQDLSFRRKEDAREIPNAIEIGLKRGVNLPPGLNTGHQVGLLIDRETLPYSDVKSFDELPIPFRCVSTELISGKAYVFKEGSLSEAMRATMSIPGVFAPVRRDNQIFVDGGLVDNLPTDVVRGMGADIVIGVHLQISATSADEIQSAFSVLGRSVGLIIAETEIRGMGGADIIVKADVAKYTTMQYDKYDELIKIGYDSAEAKASLLKPYQLDDAAWIEYQREKQLRTRSAIGTPQFVRVVGVEGVSAKSVQESLEPIVGKPLDQKSFDQVLTSLTGIGRFDSVSYDMIRENGQEGLVVYLQEKTYAPPTLRPAFVIDGQQTDDVTFTLATRLTVMDIAGFRSEWRTDFTFGQTYGIATELYRPFTPLGKWFFAPSINGSDTTFRIYEKQNPKAEYRLDRISGAFDLGYAFSRFSEARVGYEIGYGDAELRLGVPDYTSFSGRLSGLRARYILDYRDQAIIPTRGYYLQSNFHYYDTYPLATKAFPILEVIAQYFHPIGHGDMVFVSASGGSTLGYGHIGTASQFFLGGIGRLSAYGLNELQGNQYFLGRTGYFKRVFELPPFIGRDVYIAGFGEVGKMYGDPFDAPNLSADGAAGLVAVTAFGPVFIGGSAGDTGHHKWFFQMGRVF
jgi:NTE family protein